MQEIQTIAAVIQTGLLAVLTIIYIDKAKKEKDNDYLEKISFNTLNIAKNTYSKK